MIADLVVLRDDPPRCAYPPVAVYAFRRVGLVEGEGGGVVGCAIQLAVAIGLSWTYRQFALAGQLEAPADWIAAVVAAIATTLGLASLADAFGQFGVAAALRRSDGGKEPSEGNFVAMIGTLHPLGEGLRSPLRGRPCVAYDYQMRSGEGAGVRAEGRGLAPCVVRGPAFEWRILDFPDLGFLEAVGESGGEGAEELERARSLVARVRAVGAGSGVRHADEPEPDAPRFEDRIRGSLGDEDVASLELSERVLPVGARARVYGTWSRARGGLVHGRSERGRLWIGPVGVAGFASRFWQGLLLLVAVHTALYYPWVAARRERAAGLGQSLCPAVERGSAEDVASLLESAPVDARCTGGGTPLHRSRDAAITASLLEAGADVEAIDDLGRTAPAGGGGRRPESQRRFVGLVAPVAGSGVPARDREAAPRVRGRR
jgi:hypothetical protein